MHQPNPGGVYELPGRLTSESGMREAYGAAASSSRLRSASRPLRSNLATSLRAAERSAAVEEQERAGGRRNVSKPRRAEHEGSMIGTVPTTSRPDKW